MAGKIAARILPKNLREIDGDEKYGLWPNNVNGFELARTAILDRIAKLPEPMPIENIPLTTKSVALWRRQTAKIAIGLGVAGLLFAFMRTRRRVAALRRGQDETRRRKG